MRAPDEATPLVEAKAWCGLGKATWIRGLTTASAIAEGYDVGAFSGVVVIVQKEWGLSAAEVGALVSVLYFFTALGSLGAGALADACGRRRALALVYGVLTVSTVVMAVATNFATLVRHLPFAEDVVQTFWPRREA